MGRVITQQPLRPHRDSPDHGVAISCDVGVDDDAVTFQFRLLGKIGRLIIPSASTPVRADGLWRHCCFEAFLMSPGSAAYVEFNFAPTSEWAAYQFSSYRDGMEVLPLSGIAISTSRTENDGEGSLHLLAAVSRAAIPAVPCWLGLAAVIEARDSTKSYWALRHPPGTPDFHHPDCFALTLPAPDTA